MFKAGEADEAGAVAGASDCITTGLESLSGKMKTSIDESQSKSFVFPEQSRVGWVGRSVKRQCGSHRCQKFGSARQRRINIEVRAGLALLLDPPNDYAPSRS
jgi:hypothetical protein